MTGVQPEPSTTDAAQLSAASCSFAEEFGYAAGTVNTAPVDMSSAVTEDGHDVPGATVVTSTSACARYV